MFCDICIHILLSKTYGAYTTTLILQRNYHRVSLIFLYENLITSLVSFREMWVVNIHCDHFIRQFMVSDSLSNFDLFPRIFPSTMLETGTQTTLRLFCWLIRLCILYQCFFFSCCVCCPIIQAIHFAFSSSWHRSHGCQRCQRFSSSIFIVVVGLSPRCCCCSSRCRYSLSLSSLLLICYYEHNNL